MQDNRDGAGRWLKGGPSPNPGSLTRRQAAVVRLLEGLTPKAVKTLGELMDDPDSQVRLGAAKEIVNRVAPRPTRSPTAAVNVGASAGDAHMLVLTAKARQRIAADAAVAALPVPATIIAIEQMSGTDEARRGE